MTEIRKTAKVVRENEGQTVGRELFIGDWYWVRDPKQEEDNSKRWIGCIVDIGSNYAEIHGPHLKWAGSTATMRVHFDDFDRLCEFEPDPRSYIEGRAQKHKAAADEAMQEIRDLTVKLALNAQAETPHAQALTVYKGDAVVEYKQALIKAEKTQLPALFERVKNENKMMAHWMEASMIPLQARVRQLEPIMKVIKDRIFSVELYAGLVEEIEQIQDGAPAATDEKLRLFQRRHYMDEECLANYRAGGMRFSKLGDFEAWLLEPANLNRILPFPRCMVAFKVRRLTYQKKIRSFADFISFRFDGFAGDPDKRTFIYIRNGEQVFRLNTGIEFGEQLFPDLEHSELTGKLYAYRGGGDWNIVTEARLAGMREDEARAEKEQDAKWEREKAAAKAAGTKAPSRESIFYRVDRTSQNYFLWSPESVYYDDINDAIQEMIAKHNRLGLVLQGLFDRSPVLHPHPVVRLWEPDGFAEAVVLVYDESRALSGGDPPDFEAYRQRLNATLTAGCFTVGQEEVWERREAEKYNARLNWREREMGYHHTHHRPYGDDGPGEIAEVVTLAKKGARFEWEAERQSRRGVRWYHDDPGPLKKSIVVPVDKLLNADAYTPGDFRQFYADPRTRADYVEWAYLLLAAEEWHAKGGSKAIHAKRAVERVLEHMQNH